MKKIYFCLFVFSLFLIPIVHATPLHNYYTLTLSILSYSKWASNQTPTLCVVEDNHTATLFSHYIKHYGYNYRVNNVSVNDVLKSNCQIVYFSYAIAVNQQRTLILNSSLTTDTLIFTENDSNCELGSSFCLYKKTEKVTFSINLDALTRSRIHIDPRVLLLARNSE